MRACGAERRVVCVWRARRPIVERLTYVTCWKTMDKRKKRRSPNSEELDRRLEETSRLLERRISYHRALIARERARQQLPWYRRIFAG